MKKIMLITAVFLALALTGCQNAADPTETSPEEQTENTAGTTHESATVTSASTETEPETPVSEADGREGFKFYDLTGAEIDPAEVCSYRVEYALGWTNDAPRGIQENKDKRQYRRSACRGGVFGIQSFRRAVGEVLQICVQRQRLYLVRPGRPFRRNRDRGDNELRGRRMADVYGAE